MSLTVRGGATAEELAALLAVLRVRSTLPRPPGDYERWRATRLAALRTGGGRRPGPVGSGVR